MSLFARNFWDSDDNFLGFVDEDSDYDDVMIVGDSDYDGENGDDYSADYVEDSDYNTYYIFNGC